MHFWNLFNSFFKINQQISLESNLKPLRGTIQLAFPWIPRTSWKFRGEFSWIPRPSWIPWKFRGIHENIVDSMKTLWSPWKVRGFHENFVGSMETSWSPWKLRGFHENFVETRNIRGFHEIPWMPWKSMDSTNSLKLIGPYRKYLYNTYRYLSFLALFTIDLQFC